MCRARPRGVWRSEARYAVACERSHTCRAMRADLAPFDVRPPFATPFGMKTFGVLVRSMLAGGAATVADVLVLFACMHAFGWSARAANVPALLAGGVVAFFGNRHFAFRAASGSLSRQASLFLLAELVTLALNGVLYDLVVRTVHPGAGAAIAIRLLTQNVVFLAWSFPVWRLVFRPSPEARSRAR